MVYVIFQNGQPLMPTENHAKVRVLLKTKKAKVIRRCPFTIQLMYESTTHTQPVSLGIDAGSGRCNTQKRHRGSVIRTPGTERLPTQPENTSPKVPV